MRAQGDSSPREASPYEACISVRLRTGSGAAEPDSSLWESDSPAVCLILDLIAASEGVLMASQKGVLVTGFPSFQSAVLAARRLQWAIQGFSEAEEAQAASLALLIHTPEETTGETAAADVLHGLEEAAPGAILLTEKASQFFENLPGFPMQAASGEGLRELEWRGPESQSTRSFDEEILARLTAEQGAPDQSPYQSQEQPAPPEADLAAAGGAEDLEQLRSGAGRGKSRWLVGSLALAALVLAAGAALYLFRGKLIPATNQNQAQARTQAPAQTTTQAQSAPAPEAATAPAIGQVEQGGPPSPARPAPVAGTGHAETPAAAKATKNLPKVEVKPPAGAPEKQAPKAVEPPAAKVNNARCDLEPSQYSGQIDQAWKNLGRGRYADAKREFSAVLACDPNNAGAKVGLERARMAASQADGVPEN